MSEAENIVLTIFGGIIALAIISVIVGRQSQAPAAISAFSNGLANVVGAAVNTSNVSPNTSTNSIPNNFGILNPGSGW